MTKVIKCYQVTKNFSQTIALQDITCSIEEGKITAILGRNGSGKTTLIKLMLNMLSPSSGNIYYDDKAVEDIGRHLYKRVAAVLESVDNLYDYMTGMENIEYFIGLQNIKKSTIIKELNALLIKLRLDQAVYQKCGSYSRGMKQKLSIIIALMSGADILFLDEPTLGLDFESYQLILETLRWLVEKKKKTIILTSHQADLIESVADRVLLLDDGRLLFSGTLSEFKSRNIANTNYSLTYHADGGKVASAEKSDNHYQISFSNHQSLVEFLHENHNLLPFILTIEEKNNGLDDVLRSFYKENSDVSSY